MLGVSTSRFHLWSQCSRTDPQQRQQHHRRVIIMAGSKHSATTMTTSADNNAPAEHQIGPGADFPPESNMHCRSLLLDLAPELRNTIYGMVISSIVKVCFRNNPKEHIVNHALAYTSHQIRNEFLYLARTVDMSTVATITTDIHNYDFRKLVTFLNRLPATSDEPGAASR